MARVRKGVRIFILGVSVGALLLFVVLKVLPFPETKPVVVYTSPYLSMKKERQTLIDQAFKNGEDLLVRGKLFKLYRPTFTCPYKVVQWGSVVKNGAKWVCGAEELYSDTNSRTCVVYSFGVDGDSSFEADILNKTNCNVYAYDHTVDTISKPLRPDNPRVKFGKYGLQDFSTSGDSNFKTIKDVMSMNGHDWIDILKLDVEGAEYDGMTMLMNDFEELPIGQLQVELHSWHEKSQIYSKIVPWLNRLEEKGLRTFWATPNARDPAKFEIDCNKTAYVMRTHEYSFINVNAEPFRNSSFTFEKLLMGAAINTDLHYPVN